MFKLVVLSCVLAVTSASNYFGGYVAPIAPLAYAAPFLQPSNYRGPLSLAPGQPANIIAADGRPLDTLDVNLDRSAHFTAKALDNGFHILKKRSATIIAPYSTPLLQPNNYRGPLSLPPGQIANIIAPDGRPLDTLEVNVARAAHLRAKAYALNNVHFLKKRSATFVAPYSTPLLQPNNYRGPLSLPPGQIANIIAPDGRPLDTLEVNVARAAHLRAKAYALNNVHFLKKRSATFVAPYSTPLLQPNNYRGPLSLPPGQIANIIAPDGRPLDTLEVNVARAAHLRAKAYALNNVHFLKKRSATFIAPFNTFAVARTPLITPTYYSTPIGTHVNPITYAATPFAHVL